MGTAPSNASIQQWVKEVAALCQPDQARGDMEKLLLGWEAGRFPEKTPPCVWAGLGTVGVGKPANLAAPARAYARRQ